MLLFTSCSITRDIQDKRYLVRKIDVQGVPKGFANPAKDYVDKSLQPNTWINLQFYYLFNKKGKKDLGDPPAILDSSLVEASRIQMEQYFRNKGFLNAKVACVIKTRKRKAKLIFVADAGPLFSIHSFSDSIADPDIARLYYLNRENFPSIQPGNRFDKDSLANYRDEFYYLMQRNGYYEFSKQYINFSLDSSNNNPGQVDVVMIVDNQHNKKKQATYTINNTTVVIAPTNTIEGKKADTIQMADQVYFVDYSRKFNHKIILPCLFQRKGALWDIDKQRLTTARLSELNVFQNVPTPDYQEVGDNGYLNASITLIPLKRLSNNTEVEVLYSTNQLGLNVGNVYSNRNLFRGAELLQIKINWRVFFEQTLKKRIFSTTNRRFNASVNLIYPRIVMPFNFPVSSKHAIPRTVFSSAFENFHQKDVLSRAVVTSSISYNWQASMHSLHTFTPIDVMLWKGKLTKQARQRLQGENRQDQIRVNNREIFRIGSGYSYQFNGNYLNSYHNFTYFYGKVSVAGNTLNLLTRLLKTKRDSLGQRTIGNRVFAQYAQVMADLRFYRSLGLERQLVARFHGGIGIPYGNSNDLIFEDSFYAGGTNDMRAWPPRRLGPGRFQPNKHVQQVLESFYHLGELKLLANLEYRCTYVNNFFGSKIKGCFFTDCGNIWHLKPRTNMSNSTFALNTFLQSIAIGIGTGIRLDFSFFVVRIDVSWKLKDPQFTGTDQWVLAHHFNELLQPGAFSNSYESKTGTPYQFMQWNFGIGMPF